MNNKTLSDLIGQIYDAAFNLDSWPILLDSLSVEIYGLVDEEAVQDKSAINLSPVNSEDMFVSAVLSDSTNKYRQQPTDKINRVSASTYSAIDMLRFHFTRAFELNRKVYKSNEERSALGEVLERLPLGVMVVDGECRLLNHNKKMDQILSNGKGISIDEGVLNANSSVNTVYFKEIVRAVADNDSQKGKTIKLSQDDKSIPISALVVPFKTLKASDDISRNKVLVLVAAPEMHLEVPTETLMSLYKLTSAEARLVSYLVKDFSLDDIAKDFGLSKHTIRTQLKSIYEKTGTHRQAELVRHVITGPAMLATISKDISHSHNPSRAARPLQAKTQLESRLHQSVRLPDHRLLGFAEYGAKNGKPVMLMHSTTGSRLEGYFDEAKIRRCGARLIVPDRPGTGLSDFKKDMILTDWANDVEFLADHLGLKDFSVIGHSLGGMFGMACAHRLKKRIHRLLLISSVAPFSTIGDLEGMYGPWRLFLSLGKHAPALLAPLIKLFISQLTPEAFQTEMTKHLPAEDRALFFDKNVSNLMDANVRESLRQGSRHVFSEILMMSGDWGFELSQVQVPVELWSGEQDQFMPIQMTKKLTASLPICQLRPIVGAGHLVLYHCWNEILKASITAA